MLNEVAFFTPRVPELADFYGRLLSREPDESSDGHVEFHLGAVLLLIHKGPALNLTAEKPFGEFPPEEDHTAFAVADLNAVCAMLRESDSPVLGPHEFPWGISAYTRDPDGRMVEIVQT